MIRAKCALSCRYGFGAQLDEDEVQLEIAAAIKRKDEKKAFKPISAQAGKVKAFLRRGE
jgi:hypothetical protein